AKRARSQRTTLLQSTGWTKVHPSCPLGPMDSQVPTEYRGAIQDSWTRSRDSFPRVRSDRRPKSLDMWRITLSLFRKSVGSLPQQARRRLTSALAMLLWLSLLAIPADRGATAHGDGHEQKKVLVLYTDRRDLPSTGRVDDAHRIALAEGLGDRLDYYS